MTYCPTCKYIIEPTELVHCCVCNESIHGTCAVPCGAYERTEEAETTNERVRCDNTFCLVCAARSLTCRYPQHHSTVDSSDEIQHADGVPLCYMHASGCEFCRFAVCCEHMKPDYSVSTASFEVFDCSNCGNQLCDLHAVMCEECGETECVVCAGLLPSETDRDWVDVYEGNYLCKTHRKTQHDEADVPRPDSPVGQPMTLATKKRLALHPKDPRFTE